MVDTLLTDSQKEQIVKIIRTQCNRFQTFENQFESLFYDPYTQMRHKHTVTSAIISGFAPGRFQIDGISSVDLNYGLHDKLVQPELYCEKGIFHIYSDGSDLKGGKLLQRCKEMNDDLSNQPVFFLIIASVSKIGQLKKVELCLPNQQGTIIERSAIYQRQKIVGITA